MKMTPLLIVLVMITSAGLAFASTINVDVGGAGDYLTIQEGVAAASPGDTVVVASGTYTGPLNREIDFNGKSIVLLSESGRDNTIIDCQGAGRAFVFHLREDENTAVQGFTITNGLAGEGGAIRCETSSPRILECSFSGNSGEFGGALFCGLEAWPDIEYCAFSENIAQGYGGAIYTYGARVYVLECDFNGNTAGFNGGAISVKEGTIAKILNCRFRGNSSGEGGAIYIGTMLEDPSGEDPEYSTIGFSTFFDNTADRGGAVFLNSFSWVTAMWCTFARNAAIAGGGLFGLTEARGQLAVQNCTFCFNRGETGGAICVGGTSPFNELLVTQSILAFSSLGNSLHRLDWGPVVTTYCLAYGNEGGDVLYGDPNLVGPPYDPLFCDVYADNFNLCVNSPARDFHHFLIGSCRQTCAACTAPVEDISWGAIKALFR